MKLFMILCTTALTWVGMAGANANGHMTKISAVLDYRDLDGPAADDFFESLYAQADRPIWLELEIIPRQPAKTEADQIADGEPGYTIKADGRRKRALANSEFLCGLNETGILENYRHGYELKFRHPAHYHMPTTIIVGSRKTYPFQSIHCGVENYTEAELTHLHLKGAFIVQTADIPTAREFVLYPYKKSE